MIKRLVQMKLIYGKEVEFLRIFNQVRDKILSQPGCLELEAWQDDIDGQNGFWTVSNWASVEDLEAYRQSELFRSTWAALKPLFASKAKAWTLTEPESLP